MLSLVAACIAGFGTLEALYLLSVAVTYASTFLSRDDVSPATAINLFRVLVLITVLGSIIYLILVEWMFRHPGQSMPYGIFAAISLARTR